MGLEVGVWSTKQHIGGFVVGFNGFRNCVLSQQLTGGPMERAETHSSVPYVHAPALQRAVKTLIFVDFEKNGKSAQEQLQLSLSTALLELLYMG